MKIGLNATCMNERPSGAKHRFVGIYSELVKRMPESQFVVYEPSDCRVAAWFERAPNVVARQTAMPSESRARRLFGGFRYWGLELARERFDAFECLNLPVVKAPTGRTLTTIHDIRGLRPESGVLERSVFAAVLLRSLRAVDHVITVSESMRREILAVHPGTSVSVVYNGLDAAEYDRILPAELEAFRSKFTLPSGFVLSVGHFEPRKNYARLIDAMALLSARGRSAPLLIIGNDSGELGAIEARIASAGLEGSVTILSGLTDLEVRCAYTLCALFVFPSAYEGFGIPMLEAMAARRPMVLSNIPVFREITEDQGVYFPPDDAERMAAAIELGLSSAGERARLEAYGAQRIKLFSYSALAARLEAVYRSLV